MSMMESSKPITPRSTSCMIAIDTNIFTQLYTCRVVSGVRVTCQHRRRLPISGNTQPDITTLTVVFSGRPAGSSPALAQAWCTLPSFSRNSAPKVHAQISLGTIRSAMVCNFSSRFRTELMLAEMGLFEMHEDLRLLYEIASGPYADSNGNSGHKSLYVGRRSLNPLPC